VGPVDPDDQFEGQLAGSQLRELRALVHAGLNTLQVAATGVGTAERRFAFAALDAALEYVQETLLPACRAEEATLFEAVDGLTGVRNSCHVMKAQHTTLIRMAGDLAQAVEAAKAAGDPAEFAQYLQPLLYGLYALARAHLEAEDEAYVGLVEAVLSSVQVESLAKAMEAAAADPSASD
jgi:hypothetical protein